MSPTRASTPLKEADSPVAMIIDVLLGPGFLDFIPSVLAVALAYVHRGQAPGYVARVA